MSELLGVTTHMLRHYEKKGIISPDVDETNGYRYYTVIDTRRFNLSRELLACGIPLEHCAQLLSDISPEAQTNIFNDAIAEQKKRIILSNIAIRYMNNLKLDFYDPTEKLDHVWVEELRPMWRLNLSLNEKVHMEPGLKRQREEWLSCLPAVYWTSKIRREELRRFSTGPINYEYGLMCYEEDALALGLERTLDVETVPSGDYLVTIHQKNVREAFTWEDLRILTDYVKKEQIHLHGDAFSHILVSRRRGDQTTNYHRVFMKLVPDIPVDLRIVRRSIFFAEANCMPVAHTVRTV